MNVSEAETLLKRNKIDPFIYNIGPPRLAECLVIEKRGLEWIVYTWEKGKEILEGVYYNEDTAARAFLAKVVQIASIGSGQEIVLK